MVTKRPSEEDLAVHISNFGGLNTTASPLSLPVTDACRLLNVDTDVSGDLIKRQGTQQLYATGFSGDHYLHNVTLNSGIQILLGVYNRGLRFFWFNNDTATLLTSFTSVFKYLTSEPYFTDVPGEPMRTLITQNTECPKQVTYYEFVHTVSADNTTSTFATKPILVDQTVCDKCEVFVNGRHVPAGTVTYGATNCTVTVGTGLVVGDVVSVVLFTWQWWAEAEYWYGSDFRKTVPRFGASEADKLVVTPPSIITDMDVAHPYGITLYSEFDNLVLEDQYTRTSTPTTRYQYSWSNGNYPTTSEYNLDTTTVNYTTPNFVAFGAEANIVEYSNLELPDFKANAVVHVPLHKFRNGDVVELIQTLPDQLSTNTTTHFVKVLSADYIQLCTTLALTTPSTLTISNIGQNIASADVNVAGNSFTVGAGPMDTRWNGTLKILPNGTTLPGGVSVATNYYIFYYTTTPAVLGITVDQGLKWVVDITAAADCYIYTTRRIILRKKINNTVTFNRARELRFNGDGLITATYLDVVINNFFGLVRNTNLAAVTTGYALLTDANNLGTHVPDNNTGGKYLAIVNQLSDDDTILLANKEPVWTGSSSLQLRFVENNAATHEGGYYPAYGFGRYANYRTGSFPSVCVFHQERIFFGGFRDAPSTVVASGVADYVKDNWYNFYQITDALPNNDDDPFDFILSDSSLVEGFVSWQQLLFVFTKESVYRSLNVQSILSPVNRAFINISNTGLVSKYGTCVTGSDIFYISRNGVYSVPIVFEGEYRTEEISIKIRDSFTQEFKGLLYHKRRQKVWMWSEQSTYVFDIQTTSWTRYDTYLGFNHASVSEYFDYTLGWSVASGCHNVSFVGLVKWYAERYLDFAKYVPFASSPVVIPALLTEQITTNANQTEYRHSTFTEVLEDVDYKVFYGNTQSTATEIQVTKLQNNHFRLDFLPTDNYKLFVVPNPRGSWYGWGMYLDNHPVYLTPTTFGALDFDNVSAVYSYNLANVCLSVTDSSEYVQELLTIGTDECVLLYAESDAWLGTVYPTEFMSVAYSQNYLAVYKRVEEVYCWFTQRRERYNASDYNNLGSFSISLINALKYPTLVSVALVHNTSQEAAVEYDLLSSVADESMDEWALFRLHLQRLGYVYRLYVTSSNCYSWRLTAYQIKATALDGSGFISGGK